MKYTIAVVALLGHVSSVQLNRANQDNLSGLEIMANGTPEVFPLRGNAKKIEDTWVRGTTNSAMVPASLSSAPASKSDLQL